MITYDDIDTPEKAERLRLLRNECAEWMTRDTRQITAERQQVFYREKLATGRINGFLILDHGKPAALSALVLPPEPVAYGLLVWDDEGRAWSSTGVKASRRGEGFGRMATVENARRAHARGVPIWAEVRADNTGQQRICRTVGYIPVSARDGLDVFRCDKLVPEYA